MAERKTKYIPEPKQRSFPVAAGELIEQGKIVMLNATGFALEGATATGQKMVGMALETVDNSTGADGDLSVEVFRGLSRWASGTAGDAIDRADIGATVYIIDDETVGLTDGGATRSAAGTVDQVDGNGADGVWVKPAN